MFLSQTTSTKKQWITILTRPDQSILHSIPFSFKLIIQKKKTGKTFILFFLFYCWPHMDTKIAEWTTTTMNDKKKRKSKIKYYGNITVNFHTHTHTRLEMNLIFFLPLLIISHLKINNQKTNQIINNQIIYHYIHNFYQKMNIIKYLNV